MNGVFLASLIVGLGIAVRVMMFGVERSAPTQRADRNPVSLAPVTAAAFGIVFGALGYVLTRVTSIVGATSIAAACGALVAVGVVWVVRRTARVVPAFDFQDPRFALQGHLAQVVRSISSVEDGEIVFSVDSSQRTVRARSLGEESVEAGADVVIERIEDDVAYVEPWHEVEKRL